MRTPFFLLLKIQEFPLPGTFEEEDENRRKRIERNGSATAVPNSSSAVEDAEESA
jgi:hypothetical protein